MGKKIIIVDDLDGSEHAIPTRISVEGRHFVVDLSTENRKALLTAIKPFALAGRRISPTEGQRTRKRDGITDKGKGRAIRAWAKEKGLVVAETGRIPDWLEDEYDAAQGLKV